MIVSRATAVAVNARIMVSRSVISVIVVLLRAEADFPPRGAFFVFFFVVSFDLDDLLHHRDVSSHEGVEVFGLNFLSVFEVAAVLVAVHLAAIRTLGEEGDEGLDRDVLTEDLDHLQDQERQLGVNLATATTAGDLAFLAGHRDLLVVAVSLVDLWFALGDRAARVAAFGFHSTHVVGDSVPEQVFA